MAKLLAVSFNSKCLVYRNKLPKTYKTTESGMQQSTSLDFPTGTIASFTAFLSAISPGCPAYVDI